MELCLDYATAERGMSEALNTVIASGADPYATSHTLLANTAGTLLEAEAGNTAHRSQP